MSELKPQICYSAETSLLQIDTNLDKEVGERQMERAEVLATTYGADVEQDDNRVSIEVDVSRAVGSGFGMERADDRRIGDLIAQLSILMFATGTETDRVVSVTDWFDRGARAHVFPHFQSWLNSLDGLGEAEAKEALTAMAQPFGPEQVNKVKRNFDEVAQQYSAWSFGIIPRSDRFRLTRMEETEEDFIQSEAEVRWNHLEMRTLGDCACWGVTGDDRDRIDIRPSHTDLYALIPHNWDYARQSLSLVLGIGTLARHAAEFKAPEDLLAGVEWSEPQIIPKKL